MSGPLPLLAALLPLMTAAPPEDAPGRSPNLSTNLMSARSVSRFHLTTRFMAGLPADPVAATPAETFSGTSRLTFMARAQMRLRRGLTLGATVPFGAILPEVGDSAFVFGNVGVGLFGGGSVAVAEGGDTWPAPRLGFGGAFEVLAPTAAATGRDICRAAFGGCKTVGVLRNLHAYQPEAFVDEAMFFRVRGHVEAVVRRFTVEAELSLSPGFTIEDDPQFLMMLGWAARIRIEAGPYVSPFLEIENARHVSGRDSILPQLAANGDLVDIRGRDLTTPALLTLGVRGHISGFDPALFVSIDLDEGLVMFGLDLATALRPGPRRQERDEDFLRGPGDADPWD